MHLHLSCVENFQIVEQQQFVPIDLHMSFNWGSLATPPTKIE